MKHIDISELTNLTEDDLGAGETYTVRRDGEVLGYFVPKHEEDPEKKRREAEAFRRKLAEYRANGWLDEEILDNLERSLSAPSSNGRSGSTREPDATVTVRQLDVREVPHLSDDEIRAGGNYAFERDGEVLGYFVPRKKVDWKALRKAFDALDRTIDTSLRNGYTREQLAEDLDLSKPFRDDL